MVVTRVYTAQAYSLNTCSSIRDFTCHPKPVADVVAEQMKLAMNAIVALHHAQPSVTTTILLSATTATVVDVIEAHLQMGAWTLGKSIIRPVSWVTWLTDTVVDHPRIVVRTSGNRMLATQALTCSSPAYILDSPSPKSLVFSKNMATLKAALS